MRVVPEHEKESKLKRAWYNMTKKVGAKEGVFDDEVHDRYVAACQAEWDIIVPRFSYERYIDLLPINSGMGTYVKALWKSILHLHTVPKALLLRMKECEEEESMVWISRSINLPVVPTATVPIVPVPSGPAPTSNKTTSVVDKG